MKLAWIPGHGGVMETEAADSLVRPSLQILVTDVLPIIPSVVCARLHRFVIIYLPNSNDPELEHLGFPWNPDMCASMLCETTLTRMRYQIPNLNLNAYRFNRLTSRCAPAVKRQRI